MKRQMSFSVGMFTIDLSGESTVVSTDDRSHAKIVTRVISGKPNANFLLALKNTRKRWNINTRKSQL